MTPSFYDCFYQHFVCAKCEKPFYGHRYYERKGLAYCETHYNEVCTNFLVEENQIFKRRILSLLWQTCWISFVHSCIIWLLIFLGLGNLFEDHITASHPGFADTFSCSFGRCFLGHCGPMFCVLDSRSGSSGPRLNPDWVIVFCSWARHSYSASLHSAV